MKKPENWDDVQEKATENILKEAPPAGGTVFHILSSTVTTEAGVEILRVKLDIIQGRFKFYYSKLFDITREDLLIRLKFSKENLSRLKAFITCVTDANKGFVWNWDEKKLLFKNVAGNLRYREYKKKDNTIICVPYVPNFCRLGNVDKMKGLPIKKLSTVQNFEGRSLK
ncbi:MAG: hypothetical protein JW915_24120 [Chitinispirillaceae bacterium]|nr:hypothetical protein [Chitinispirillaceae bacterium]